MKKQLISTVVLLLVVVNVWQWWPYEENHTADSVQTSGHMSLLIIPLPDYSRKSMPTVQDPFYGAEAREQAKAVKVAVPVKRQAAKKTQDPFKNYQVAGILYKNRRMNAFMVISGENRIVKKGDIINGRIKVERITELSVTLRDTRNNQKRTIKLQ